MPSTGDMPVFIDDSINEGRGMFLWKEGERVSAVVELIGVFPPFRMDL